MDRYPGYESMLARVEHMKMQVKAQLPTEYSHTVDNMVDFVLDEVNQCCDVPTVDVATDTAQDHPLSGGPVARADDTRIDVNEHVNPASPQADHHIEGSISSGQTVSLVGPPPPATHSTIHTNIEVKVEDESNGQSVQLCEWIKKEEDEEQLFHCCDCGGEGCEECKVKMEMKEELGESGCETELGGSSVQGYIRVKQEEEDSDGEGDRPKKMLQYVSSEQQLVQHFKCVKKEEEDGGEYVMECDCEDCETCRVKMEMKEELGESGFEMELGGNSAQVVQGCTRVKKEESEDEAEVERPNKIRRMDRVVGNVPIGPQSPLPNVISVYVECPPDQMATSFINRITIEDLTQPSQPVTIPTPIVTPTQSSSSSSAQHVYEPLRDQLLNGEPMMDNVVEVGEDEFDREQFGDGNSTLNPVHTEQDDEVDEANVEDDQNDDDNSTEQREDLSADDDERQVPVENFMKRIKPTDEQGNHYLCDYRGCGRRMKLRTDLIRHIQSQHTGERPFKCSVEGCNRAFVQKTSLKEHLNTHTGSRPNVCSWPGCDARFGNKSTLTAHIRTHTGDRPFKCETCNATFTQNSSLITHLRTHTGSRPFVCTWPDCGQAFISSSHLYGHSRVHSNERHVCDVSGCAKAYKSKESLRRHQKAKHN